MLLGDIREVFSEELVCGEGNAGTPRQSGGRESRASLCGCENQWDSMTDLGTCMSSE